MATDAKPARATVVLDRYGPSQRSAWMDIDWREHQRWVRVQDRWMNVIELGPDDPVGTIVWIHGLSGCWQNWLENLPHFARTHRCVAMDLPGFGESEMPAHDISIRGYAESVDALLTELGVERAVVVGNSMGGFIGAEISIEFSTRADRLVLVSAAGLSLARRPHPLELRALRVTENVVAMSTAWLGSKADWLAKRPRSRHAMFNLVAAHPARLPGPLVAEQLRGSGKPGFLDALEALLDYPLEDRLEKIQAPTLVVWGEDDALIPVEDAWRFGELIGDAKVVVYEDTGHVAMLERPDAFNALVGEFLDIE